MKTFRRILFWMHLAAGLIAGLVIGIMCFTGIALAFEDEIVAWAERDARAIAVPPAAPVLPLADLQRKLRDTHPEFRATAVTVQKDPAAAIAFSAGRDAAYYVNPYTGEIRQPASSRTHDFMELMLQWHRFLGRSGDQRPIGKAINGAANIAFCFLALSGLYLWLPRTWSWRGVKAVAWFDRAARGKGRDFNWHNVIGLWCAPFLVVLTLTAIPISYRWGSNLVYQLVGEVPPAPPGPGGTAVSGMEIKRPAPDAPPLGYGAIVTQAQMKFPHWEQVTVRSGGQQRGGAPQSAANTGAVRTPQPLMVTIREAGSWPRTATTTLTVNPFTGEELKREGFADFPAGRQLRTWTRFLHTGQALGWTGQLMAALACLGGCFLVYTGFALSWRRFFFKKRPLPAEPAA